MSKIQVSYAAVKSESRSNSLTFHIVVVERWAPRFLPVSRKRTLCGVAANQILAHQPVHFANCRKCKIAARELDIDLSEPSPTIPQPGDVHGMVLIPGYNVDKIDIAAGMGFAAGFGYGSPEHQAVVEYALMRHKRGEEEGAQKSALSGGIDLTSWYAILAHALAFGAQS